MKIILFLFFLISNSFFSQNGKILSKQLIELSQTSIWENISENNQLQSEYKYLNDLNFYEITYQSDELSIKGMIVEPKKDGKYPVVIFNRGGNRNFAPLNIGTLMMYTSQLANQGYLIISSNYREKDEFGDEEINDVLNLTETIKELDKADSTKIGMFGWSRGGMMTYLSLQKSDKIKTAIIGNGPSNLFESLEERPEMEKVFYECIPNYSQNKKEELQKRSAIYWTEKLNKKSSLLILSGTKDDRVNPQQAEKIVEKLKIINYNFEFKKFETDHYFSDKKQELNELVINWFNQKLKN